MHKSNSSYSSIILVAEDDEDDRLLLKDALAENNLSADIHFVEDGEELLDYLRHQRQFSSPETAPLPNLIILDLNMPRKDGREALKEIKEDPKLRKIPVLVFTTSDSNEDIMRTYNLGTSSYILKPDSYRILVETMDTLIRYWFNIVRLPSAEQEIKASY